MLTRAWRNCREASGLLRICHLAFVTVLATASLSAAAAPASTPPQSDPVCGFTAGPHFYYDAAQVQHGLGVNLIVGRADVNRPVTLRFFVHQKPRNFPIDRLQIEHAKFMHVIGISDDLEEFFHIHPDRASPGTWQVTHTFSHPGAYKIWSDLKYRGVSYSFSHPLLRVGNPEAKHETPALSDTQNVSGFQICFQHPEPFTTTGTNRFQFVVLDSAGQPVETEKFLDSPMHLILVSEDLTAYLHAHPEPRREGSGPIMFRQLFRRPGAYRLFAQFRPKAAALEPEQALLAKFQIRVQ